VGPYLVERNAQGPDFGRKPDQDDARQAVRESMVLLKNTGSALPLLKTDKVVVVGPYADDMGAHSAVDGRSVGKDKREITKESRARLFYRGLRQLAVRLMLLIVSNGSAISRRGQDRLRSRESPYAEGSGDEGQNGHTLDLASNNGASALISTCVASGKPVILVMLTGRPMILNTVVYVLQCDCRGMAARLQGHRRGRCTVRRHV